MTSPSVQNLWFAILKPCAKFHPNRRRSILILSLFRLLIPGIALYLILLNGSLLSSGVGFQVPFCLPIFRIALNATAAIGVMSSPNVVGRTRSSRFTESFVIVRSPFAFLYRKDIELLGKPNFDPSPGDP